MFEKTCTATKNAQRHVFLILKKRKIRTGCGEGLLVHGSEETIPGGLKGRCGQRKNGSENVRVKVRTKKTE